MNKEADGGARRGVPVAHGVRDRQDRFLADEGLADDVGEEARGCLVRRARTDADRRQADADAVDEALAAVIGEQQFRDLLLRAVARKRRVEIFLGDRFGEGGAKDGNR